MLDVGRIVKPHGLRGEVIVELFTNRDERVSPGTVLTVPGGSLVVKRSQPHQHRWIVQFEGVATREGADDLRDTVLSAEPLEDPDAMWVHEMIDAEVRDNDDRPIGKVTGILANPAGDILEVGPKVLIPLRFVVEQGDGFIRVDPPAGLLEINES